MQSDDRIRIRHMIEAAETAISFTAGRGRSDLDTDRMLLFALVRAVEIVGEAASRLSEDARSELSDVPWRQIVAMRNRLIHAYFDISPDVVWKAATEEIPPLLERLRAVPLDD
ncbi:MAG: DUF86 domain-containing protein [Defluviicoccus sp.]